MMMTKARKFTHIMEGGEKMANEAVKDALKRHGVPQWELGKELNVSENTMYRKLRTDLPKQEQEQLIRKVEEIASQREKDG